VDVRFGVYAPLSPFGRILETARLAEKQELIVEEEGASFSGSEPSL